MSGTSIDGVDAALVRINGSGQQTEVELLHFITLPFSKRDREDILRCTDPEHSNVPLVCHLNFRLGYLFANAVQEVCRKADLPLEKLDFIASHGQTIYHLPHGEGRYERSTLQIGEPAVIAYETGVNVISNFRSMDMAAGGEGAPLVPYADYLLYRSEDKGVALQNIGGIGNVTAIPKEGVLDDLLAFDTGPGNMIIDQICQIVKGEPFDDGGKWAALGKVHYPIVDTWMESGFFTKPPPKSTGREEFGQHFTEKIIREHQQMTANDLIATTTYFTAKSIADGYQRFILPRFSIDEIIVGGGGSLNQTLLQFIQELLPDITVRTQEDLGFSSEAKEAIAFAILGNETMNLQPANVPKATGASKAVVLGSITWGRFI